MENFQFYSPTEFVFGRDTETKAGEMVKKYGGTKVLIHYGSGSAVKSGLIAKVRASLSECGIEFTELGGVQPNPRDTLIYKGIQLCRDENVDFILSVGGGSCIDSSKAIALGVPYDGDFWDFYGTGKEVENALPIGTILTIAAAGSEGSGASVVTKEEGSFKRDVGSDKLRPRFSILDPELTCSLPAYQTACGATDIMAHVFERYFTKELLAKKGKKHIITSVFEHHAVLHTTEYLEKHGFEITYIPVSDKGLINPDDIRKAIREDTALVTIMYANNEIGTIQPINEIAAICNEKGVLFHTDAVQAVGHVDIDVHKQGIDMLSLSGHKIHAQKGIGALYIRKGLILPNLIHGGGQERGKRAGTENVPAIVGLGVAIEAATRNIIEKNAVIVPRRNKLIDNILKLPYTRLNGDKDKRLPGNVNIW